MSKVGGPLVGEGFKLIKEGVFMKKSWLSNSVFQLSVGVAGVAAAVFANSQVSDARIKAPKAMPGEIIVKMRETAGQSAGVGALDVVSQAEARAQFRAALFQALGPNAIQSVTGLQMDDSIQKIVLADAKQTKQAIAQLKESLGSAVKYAEPNYVYTTQMGRRRRSVPREPNDADWSKQWDMKNTGQLDKPEAGQEGTAGADINVTPVWGQGYVGDRRMVVAIIDTGIDYTHPDLAANIYTNPNEVAGNGVDDDNNGIVDDVHGASFVQGSGTGNGMDDHNHGTHCAGTIGAVGNDGNGIAGVNWEVSMLPVKFLSASGSGSLEGAINAVKYATKMGAKVMSNSWGGGGFSEALRDAIQESADAGALFIAAAGNDGSDNDGSPTYPANYAVSNVISVAATDNKDVIASFSNWGKRTVHVSAPGKNILSTVRGGYATYSGTSMATPHVSGIAALIWAANPNWSAAEVKTRLINTSSPVQGLKKKSLSRGRVNAFNALQNIVAPNDDPAESAWKNVDYALESTHPYADGVEQSWEISAPGATHIRIVFEKIETEARYDALSLETMTGEVIETISGTQAGQYVTDYVKADKVMLKFKSDSSVNGYGFKIAKIQVIEPSARQRRRAERQARREMRRDAARNP